MNTFLKVLLTALAVLILSNILPGIHVEGYLTAIVVAITIGLLNMFIKPLLVILTLPITIITLGLFLFVINAIVILMSGYLIDGFIVDGVFTAFLFSVLLSVFRSLLFKLLKEDKSE